MDDEKEKTIRSDDPGLGNLFARVNQKVDYIRPPIQPQNHESIAEEKRQQTAKIVKQWLMLKQFDPEKVIGTEVTVGHMAQYVLTALTAGEIFFLTAAPTATEDLIDAKSYTLRLALKSEDAKAKIAKWAKESGLELPIQERVDYDAVTLVVREDATLPQLLNEQNVRTITDLYLRHQMATYTGTNFSPRFQRFLEQNHIKVILHKPGIGSFPEV